MDIVSNALNNITEPDSEIEVINKYTRVSEVKDWSGGPECERVDIKDFNLFCLNPHSYVQYDMKRNVEVFLN